MYFHTIAFSIVRVIMFKKHISLQNEINKTAITNSYEFFRPISPISNSESTNFFKEYLLRFLFQLAN